MQAQHIIWAKRIQSPVDVERNALTSEKGSQISRVWRFVFVSADGSWEIEDGGMWVDGEGVTVELRYSVSVHDHPIVSRQNL
jgi:hypothetical protein